MSARRHGARPSGLTPAPVRSSAAVLWKLLDSPLAGSPLACLSFHLSLTISAAVSSGMHSRDNLRGRATARRGGFRGSGRGDDHGRFVERFLRGAELSVHWDRHPELLRPLQPRQAGHRCVRLRCVATHCATTTTAEASPGDPKSTKQPGRLVRAGMLIWSSGDASSMSVGALLNGWVGGCGCSVRQSVRRGD